MTKLEKMTDHGMLEIQFRKKTSLLSAQNLVVESDPNHLKVLELITQGTIKLKIICNRDVIIAQLTARESTRQENHCMITSTVSTAMKRCSMIVSAI
jgi:hypothetical protein